MEVACAGEELGRVHATHARAGRHHDDFTFLVGQMGQDREPSLRAARRDHFIVGLVSLSQLPIHGTTADVVVVDRAPVPGHGARSSFHRYNGNQPRYLSEITGAVFEIDELNRPQRGLAAPASLAAARSDYSAASPAGVSADARSRAQETDRRRTRSRS